MAIFTKTILAQTQEGRDIEILEYRELHCTAFSHSGNPYTTLQSEADAQGFRTEKRDLRYMVAGLGPFSSLARIADMYRHYMNDPIVVVVCDDPSDSEALL